MAHVLLMRASANVILGYFRDGAALSETGVELCITQCRGVSWELASFHSNILLCATYLGELEAARKRMLDVLDAADQRGDRFARAMLPAGPQNVAWLGAHDLRTAEQLITDAVGPSFEEDNDYHLYLGEFARGRIDLYDERPRDGRERMTRLISALKRGWLNHMPSIMFALYDLRARCALAEARARPERSRERDELLRAALADVARIKPARAWWYAPFVARARGLAAALAGRQESAHALLERAAVGFRRLDMPLYEAGTALQLAILSPDATETAADAEARLRRLGVVRPAQFAAVC